MTAESVWRVELGRKIATWYAGHPEVRMVGLGGSVARGIADDYSDLDLGVYWQTMDMEWLAEPPLAPAGAERFTYRATVDDVYLEQYRIGGAKVDVAHLPIHWWDNLMDEVLHQQDVTEWKLDTLGGFAESIVYHGADEFEPRRRRILDVSDALAEALVRAHLRFYPRWVMEAHDLGRSDLLGFHNHRVEAIKHMVGVVAGVNRRLISADKGKRAALTLTEMALRPPGIEVRIHDLLRMPDDEVPAALEELVRELLTFVERHLPSFDTASAHAGLAYPAYRCEQPPDFKAAPRTD